MLAASTCRVVRKKKKQNVFQPEKRSRFRKNYRLRHPTPLRARTNMTPQTYGTEEVCGKCRPRAHTTPMPCLVTTRELSIPTRDTFGAYKTTRGKIKARGKNLPSSYPKSGYDTAMAHIMCSLKSILRCCRNLTL